jgi:dTDP-6-deoxy-L-talose 4-dehydrogenase (NAD+)
MRVAVTGATGFIGRHLLPTLADQGAQVTVMLRPGSQPKSWMAALDSAEIDLHEPPPDAFTRLGRPEVVIHLAWQGLPNYKSLRHFEDELPAQYRFLKQLIVAGLKRLVVAGTCFEYGMQSGELSEAMATAPANAYGFAKDCLRRQLEYLKASFEFALIWARLFYVYGEGQATNSLLPQLERALGNGDAVFNMSGGEQLRDFLTAEEAARHLARLAAASGDAGVVNICSGKPVSVRGFVEARLKERGGNIVLNCGDYPYPDFEPMAFWGDRRKLDRLIGS